MKKFLLFIFLFAFASFSAFAQTAASTGQITGAVKDPNQAVLSGTQVVLTNLQTKAKITAVTNSQGIYAFPAVQPGTYITEIDAKGFKPSVSTALTVAAGQTVNSDFALALAGNTETVNVSAGSFENAYRVDNVAPATPLGPVPIVNLPYTINVISRQLIDDTMSRNFKEAAKYLPLVSFQEMQGPEILRPETRGMQGTNMQGDRMDGMGFAVTVPFALEEYEQIEVVSGVGGSMYGPSNPSGTFNFVTKRSHRRTIITRPKCDMKAAASAPVTPTWAAALVPDEARSAIALNGVVGDGTGYVTNSQLRRQLADGTFDVRPFAHTTIGGNFSYYNLFQHGYPGWFSYNPTLNPTMTCTTAYNSNCFSILPVNAPDPARQGYGQRFLGSNTNNQIGEVRAKHDFSENWHLSSESSTRSACATSPQQSTRSMTPRAITSTEAENIFQGTISGRFQVKSDLGYVTGKFKTGKIGHEVVIGSTGYRFASWQPKNSPHCCEWSAGRAILVPAWNSSRLPFTTSTTRMIAANPGFIPYTGEFSLYVTSIIHQQGFNFGDTIDADPALAFESGRQPGLDLDEQLHSYRVPPGKVNTVHSQASAITCPRAPAPAAA